MNDIGNISSLKHLIESNITWDEVNKIKKMKLAKSDIDRIKEQEIKYNLSGKTFKISLKELAFFYDVTNGLIEGSEFRSPSRITALIPSLANISQAQKSKNINLKMSSKWIVSNKNDVMGSVEPLDPEEKREVEGLYTGKDIIATNSKVDAQSMAVNLKQLNYDDNVASDATKVFTAYGINRDVISYWSQGQTTHDNKTTGLLDFIQSVLEFEGADFGNTWTNFIGYDKLNKKITIKYNHLPIYQEAEKQKMGMLKERVEILKILVESGAEFTSAAQMVNLNELKAGTKGNGSEQE